MSDRSYAHTSEVLYRSSRLRALLAALIVIGGCSSFGDESAPSDTSSPTDVHGADDGGVAPDKDSAPTIEQEGGDITGTPVVSVKGKVVDSNDVPVDKQGVLAIDANGARHEATTGPDGTFVLEEVARPHDVTLVSADRCVRHSWV